MKKIPLIIDADTGIDDAVAISVASYLKNLNLLLITSTQGNTSVANTTQNNLNILHAINKKHIPVAKGSGGNLSKNDLSVNAHGSTGLGDYSFPAHDLHAISEDALTAIHNAIHNIQQPVTLLATGPLTTFAEFLRKYPEDKQNINQIVVSGGLIENLKDNEQPYLSFNIAEDSVAMQEILDSNIKLVIIPSNLGHDAYLTWQEVCKTKNTNKTGSMFEKIFRSYKDRHVKNGIATHDLCAVLAISNPSCSFWQPAKISLKYLDNLGYLAFDFACVKKNLSYNAVVATSCNIKKIKKLYFKTLKKMP